MATPYLVSIVAGRSVQSLMFCVLIIIPTTSQDNAIALFSLFVYAQDITEKVVDRFG